MTMTGTPEKSPAGAVVITPAVTEVDSASTLSATPIELIAWFLVLVAAAALRIFSLSLTPLSQAEGGRALGSWSAAQGTVLDAWPGSVLDALTALIFRVFGSGDAAARIVPAIAGMVLVASFWLLRPHMGRAPVLVAAILSAISPVFVYDARTVGSQALGAALAVAVAAVVLSFLARPRPRLLIVAATLLSFGLGTDAVFLGAMLLIGLWLVLRGFWQGSDDVRVAMTAVRDTGAWLVSALPLVLAGLLLACSRFGTGFSRLRPAAAASWSLAFNPTRPGTPWHYLIDVIAGYALPATILGGVGVYLLLRDGSWRERPILGLLIVWLGGGAAVNLFMAGRDPSSLLLTFVPLVLIAGVAVDRIIRSVAVSRPETIDFVLGAGLIAAAAYTVLAGAELVTTDVINAWQVWAGLLLMAVCAGGALVRWRQDGAATAAPLLAAAALIAVLADLHGAGSVRSGGDEFLSGQRTTPQGKVFAMLLVANGGGVDDVTHQSLLPLEWYLRNTIASGGHGTAKLFDTNTQLPLGFAQSGEAANVSRIWSPRSLSGTGMLRWWIYREAWADIADVTVRLVESR